MGNTKITRTDIIKTMSKQIGISSSLAGKITETIIGKIVHILLSHEMLKISSFGSFMIKQQRLRKARHIQTGEDLFINSMRRVIFIPSINFKTRIEKIEKKKQNTIG